MVLVTTILNGETMLIDLHYEEICVSCKGSGNSNTGNGPCTYCRGGWQLNQDGRNLILLVQKYFDVKPKKRKDNI